MDYTKIINYAFYNNPVWKWGLAIGIAIVGYFVLTLVKSFTVRQLIKVASKTTTTIDDFVGDLLQKKTKAFFLLIIAVLGGMHVLTLPPHVLATARRIAVIIVLFQAALWIGGLITFLIKRSLEKKTQEGDMSSVAAFTAMGVLAKLAVWSIVILITLDNLGFNITTLVAGLGVGGVAVALATQNILGDLFASMSIALDKPFVIGDFIIVDDVMGNVEHIGLKTTRLRSLSGEQIVVSNNDLLKSRIRNYKRMNKRRIVFSFGVTYQTPHEKLAAIPGIIHEILKPIDNGELDRAHFKAFGSSSLDFEIVYYVQVPDYNTYMDIQQRINLEIYKRFAEQGIEFAYPTQTLYVQKSE
jgi:small-conductance mechanosensitive channel